MRRAEQVICDLAFEAPTACQPGACVCEGHFARHKPNASGKVQLDVGAPGLGAGQRAKIECPGEWNVPHGPWAIERYRPRWAEDLEISTSQHRSLSCPRRCGQYDAGQGNGQQQGKQTGCESLLHGSSPFSLGVIIVSE